MKDFFVGIEKELVAYQITADGVHQRISFSKEESVERGVPCVNEFSILKNLPRTTYVQGENKVVFTDAGNKIYADGGVLEVVTPAHTIKKGIATNVCDSLSIGTNDVLSCSDKYVFTGYSTHINLPFIKGTVDATKRFRSSISPIVSMFLKNPLSAPVLSRRGKSGGTEEVLADGSIPLDQLRSGVLLLASYRVQMERDSPPMLQNGKLNDDLVLSSHHSRDAQITLMNQDGSRDSLSKQTYLEELINWLSPTLNELATPTELRSIRDYMSGHNPLEIDKTAFYKKIDKSRGVDFGKALKPVSDACGNTTIEQKNPSAGLTEEGRLFGKFVAENKQSIFIGKLGWKRVHYLDFQKQGKNEGGHLTNEVEVRGIQSIYEHAKGRFGQE